MDDEISWDNGECLAMVIAGDGKIAWRRRLLAMARLLGEGDCLEW